MSRSTQLSHLVIGIMGVLVFSTPAHAAVQSNYAMTDTLNLPGSTRWDFLTFDAAHHELFITRGDSVDVLNTDTKKIIGTISKLEGVHGIALAPDLNKGFITEGKANRLTVIDATTFKILTTIPTGQKPDAVLYDAAMGRVFVADGESNDMTVIDAKTNAVLNNIKLDGQPEFMAVDGKGRLYVNLEDKSQIDVIDENDMKPVTHYDLTAACDSPTGLAIDPVSLNLFSVCASKHMMVVDSVTGKIVDTVDIGAHSDAAAFDPVTGLAFSSNGDGTLTIVGKDDDGHYRVLQSVPTKVTARTMALSPTTHDIYLAAAETEGFDPPDAKHSEPRPHTKPDTFMIVTVSPTK